jgi:hypothetical protein
MIKCDYCGRDNQDETAPCQGCGSPLAPNPDELKSELGRPASVFGVLDCVVGVAQIVTGHFGGILHVAKGLSNLDSSADENSPYRLLDHAAVLESRNMGQAIALYKWIALNHPGTPAAEEASRYLRTLTAAHPELADLPAALPKDLLP